MKTVRVFEYERLTLTEDQYGRVLTPAQLDRLYAFNDKNDNKYFTTIRDGIRFCQFVGVIRIGSLTIEILPKADRNPINELNFQNESTKWQKVLLQMLAICGEIDLESVSEANLNKRNNLLDLYYDIYLTELDKLLRIGLTKKYRDQSSDVRAFKGRLNFAKNIQKNFVHEERFYTTHQTYDHTHLINQILFEGLMILKRVATNYSHSLKVKSLLLDFPEIQRSVITAESFKKVRLTRKTNNHLKALNIAKMLILNYSPDIAKGNEDMLALLFDMNKLWEKYIYRRLKKNENDNLSVNYHESDRFWEDKKVCPDIVLVRKIINNDDETIITERSIIDTKWKIVAASNPSDDDLKQMFVYNIYWDCPKSLLLYPKIDGCSDSDFGKYHKGRTQNTCKIGFVSVLDQFDILNKNVADEILIKLDILKS